MNREIMQQALHHLVDLADDLRRIPSDIAQTIAALEAELAKPEPVQVRPHEFIAMASKQANMIGKPVVWAEYPTPHKIILDEGWEWGHEARAKEALAQPEFDTPESHIVKWSIPVDPNNFGEPLAQPEQEPVRWFQQFGDAPPKQEWVGLTDEEINDFDKKLRDNGDYCSLHFAWGISAKLKEKNGG